MAMATSEAEAIYRIGGVVYKLLWPAERFATHFNPRLRMSAEATLARWRKMQAMSMRHPCFNRMLLVERPHPAFVSRYVDGRPPTPDELQEVVDDLRRHRLAVLDVTRDNVIVGERGPVVVDFFVEA